MGADMSIRMNATAPPVATIPSRFAVYLRLGRISNLPTVWTNVLAGALLTGVPLDGGTLGVLLVSLSLFYVGGMYLNDAFDRHIDARERPERPIPSGRASAREVFGIGFGMLAAALLLLVWLGLRATPVNFAPVLSGLLLAATIVYYDLAHKRDPLSPLVMGACRVLVYVTAGLAAAGTIGLPLVGGALVLLSYLIGLTYVAKQETLAEYKNLWPLLFLFAPFVYTAPDALRSGVGIAMWVGFLAWVGYAISFLFRPGPGHIGRAVISFIAGISLLDGLLVVVAGFPRAAALAVLGFLLTLIGQRWVKGT